MIKNGGLSMIPRDPNLLEFYNYEMGWWFARVSWHNQGRVVAEMKALAHSFFMAVFMQEINAGGLDA